MSARHEPAPDLLNQPPPTSSTSACETSSSGRRANARCIRLFGSGFCPWLRPPFSRVRQSPERRAANAATRSHNAFHLDMYSAYCGAYFVAVLSLSPTCSYSCNNPDRCLSAQGSSRQDAHPCRQETAQIYPIPQKTKFPFRHSLDILYRLHSCTLSAQMSIPCKPAFGTSRAWR
mgnify:CR=1 FL=1